MSLEEAEEVAGDLRASASPLDENCYFAEARRGLPGLLLMVREGEIARIDVTEGDWETPAGVSLGDSLREVRRAYPDRARVLAHPFLGPLGHYVVVEVPPHLLLFETAAETESARETVERFRVGRPEAVRLTEGCV